MGRIFAAHQSRNLINSCDLSAQSWLQRSRNFAGCSVCKEYSGSNSLLRPLPSTLRYIEQSLALISLKTSNLAQHAKSEFHVEASCAHLGVADVGLLYGAPKIKDFIAVYEDLVDKQSSPNNGIAGVAKGGKVRDMARCLSEAVEQVDQAFLEVAVTVGILRDVRRSRLDCRFVGVNECFEVRAGLLGRKRLTKGGSVNLASATKEVLSRFSSVRVGLRRASLNKRLRRQIRSVTHLSATDAAADEMVASEILRAAGISGSIKASFTKGKAALRDKCHGSTRLLRRPFKADNELDKLMHDMIRGPNSPAQMVQHSLELQALWQKCIKDDPERLGGTYANLSAAKHRFDSYALPLGRLCLHLEGVCTFMARVAAMREGVQQERAKRWLRNCSARDSLLCGMCADASDECSAPTHFFDVEDMDAAELSGQLSAFISRMTALFGESRASLQSGYTKEIIDTVKVATLAWPDGGKVRSIKPISAADIDSAFDHMQSFLPLLLTEVEAEFPAHEVSLVWRVFAVINVADNERWVADDATKDDLRRLARVFELDFDRLLAQFLRVRGRVVLDVKKTKCNPLAWSSVMALFRRQNLARRVEDRLDLDEISQLTYQYLGWAASTSGVEQGFTQAMRAFSIFQESSDELYEEMLILLCVEGRKHDKESLPKSAQKVWVECFGSVRSSCRRDPRSDAGVKRPRAPTFDSHRAFVKRRRADAHAAASSFTRAEAEAEISEYVRAPPVSWSASHVAEETSAKNKSRIRLAQASREGALLLHEDTLDVRAEGAEQVAKMTVAQQKRGRLLSGRILRNIGASASSSSGTRGGLRNIFGGPPGLTCFSGILVVYMNLEHFVKQLEINRSVI